MTHSIHRLRLGRLARSTAWMTAARLVKMAAGVTLFGSLARALEPSSFGSWSLAIATWGLAETIRGGASSSAYLRWAALADAEELPRVTGALVQLLLAASLVLALLGGALGLALAPGELRTLVWGLMLVAVASAGTELVHVLLLSRRAFAGLFVQQGLQAAASLGASAWLVHGTEHPLEVALAGLVVGYLLGAVGPMWALRGLEVRFRDTWPAVERLFRHGRYAASSRAGSALHRSLDLWLVASLGGAEAVALYAVAWRLADYAEVLLQPVVKVLVPEISRHGADPWQAVRLAARAVVAMTAAITLVSAPMAAFPEACVTLLAGRDYVAAAPVLQALVLFNLLRPLDRCSGVYLDAIGRPELNARKVAAALGVNAGLTVVALAFGGSAALPLAALASVLGSLVGTAVAERDLARLGLPRLVRALPAGLRARRAQVVAQGGSHGE